MRFGEASIVAEVSACWFSSFTVPFTLQFVHDNATYKMNIPQESCRNGFIYRTRLARKRHAQ